ncbi:hypothetical protein PROSTU_01546 [Providencia stuartii ATCC 25827]|uniref:Uncharacterized protein n=1 Tax=Providencia stuartii ATCC 25827 TaxID=471874 RepID=A0AA86YWZ9_PROST|nr:hypothetical protein PROSTU_01546 [Providencia stuartii ATCC 25827]
MVGFVTSYLECLAFDILPALKGKIPTIFIMVVRISHEAIFVYRISFFLPHGFHFGALRRRG